MNITDNRQNAILIEGMQDFRIRHVLECGQCFRWEKEPDGSYTIMAGDRVVNIKENAVCGKNHITSVEIDNCSRDEWEDFWRHYLDIDRDYRQIKDELISRDTTSHMSAAATFGDGLRILRQDPWETIISFIISQNNNIGRIQKCIEHLCQGFGRSIGVYRGKSRYGFPGPDILAACTSEDLADCRLGYRAKYIIETARKVSADELGHLHEIGRQDKVALMEYLLSLPGVGPKVAGCIALFAFGCYGSFPIDVWVRKAMSELYGLPEDDMPSMAAFAAERYGALGGFAQQYLFYYMREKKKL